MSHLESSPNACRLGVARYSSPFRACESFAFVAPDCALASSPPSLRERQEPTTIETFAL